VKLADSVSVVTGGASGIGAGVAEMLVDGGGAVALLDRPDSQGKEVAQRLGPAAMFVSADITRPEDVTNAVRTVVDTHGRIDVLVGAAGVTASARVVDRNLTPFPLDLFRHGIEVNLIGAFDVIRCAAAEMARNDPREDGERGVVISIASIAAYEGQVGQASYSASKGGLVALTLPLARDLASHGIRVMTVCPGSIDTPMLRGTSERIRASLAEANVFPHRLGHPSDIAAVIRTCLETTYLNGEVIRVDAGVRLAPR
jgi:3-hydroxyacyl-CoA dehydrogenase / 3-hydroxy-2-methylbutyryl-CoA dehydrogenase